MPQGEQVKNGKAFEFSLAYQYYSFLISKGKNVKLVEDSALNVARGFYNSFSNEKKEEFDLEKLDDLAQKNNDILTLDILKQCKK